MDKINWIDKVKYWLASVRLIVAVVFMFNFMWFIISDSKRQNNNPNYDLCTVKVGINHPITPSALTDVSKLNFVGKEFFRIIITGFCF